VAIQQASSLLYNEKTFTVIPMQSWINPTALAALGVALAAAGIYVGETDDAPGAALIGILLMLALVFLAWRQAGRKVKQRTP
jgi:hypothetical protein